MSYFVSGLDCFLEMLLIKNINNKIKKTETHSTNIIKNAHEGAGQQIRKTVHGGIMLEIKQTELNEIEMLLNQSIKGYHFLFDHKKSGPDFKKHLRKTWIFFFNKANIQRIQELLTELLSKKSFSPKNKLI